MIKHAVKVYFVTAAKTFKKSTLMLAIFMAGREWVKFNDKENQ